jgi:nucleotide-binding universal stress UspA family protein
MNQNDLRLVIKLLLRMKTLFSKILVPIDGSEYSFNAAEYAIQISMKDKSHITFLSIYSHPN